jgi:dynein heavy chain, axonemal
MIIIDKVDVEIVKQEGKSNETQTDWSTVCEFFNNPFVLAAYELPPTIYTLANSAVREMRRYYSRKVIDVLIKITRQSIDALRKKFSQESSKPMK